MDEDPRTQRFARVALPHLGAAYRLARWLTRHHEDAEEVVQDAYLRAFRAFDGFLGRDDARAWLLTIVRHCAYALLRRRQALADQQRFDDEIDIPADGPGPEALLLRREDAQRLNETLTGLPIVFREVLVLREFEALSYREIASLLGVPMGTVMSRLARARQLLLSRLQTLPSQET